AAAALDGPEGRHEPGRAAAALPARSREVRGLAPPPPRRAARHHRPLAGQRPVEPDIRRDGAARYLVHRELVARARRQDHAAHGPGGRARHGSLLIARPRVAIACSWLNQHGGAERVLEVLHEIWPEAPVYTSAYLPDLMPAAYRGWDIRTSFMQ